MRLDFTVLWIDNLPLNVASAQQRIDLAVQKEGFKLEVIPAVSFEEAEPKLADGVLRDDIDLLVVDFDLGQGVMQGDEALGEIRRRVPFKDIVFYSATQTVDLRAKLRDTGVEGVFCAHRDELVDTVVGVFEALVKKVLDLDHCRGIVMGATSDIDYIVLDALGTLASALDAAQADRAISYALEKVENRLERFQAVRDTLTAEQTLDKILAAHEAFTAQDRLGLLKEILGLHVSDDHSEVRKAIGRYANDVVPLRNKLGHVRLVVDGGRRALRGRGDAIVSVDELRDLRRMLIEYRNSFLTLANVLGLKLD